MKRKILLTLIACCPFLTKAQVFLIDKMDSNYFFNERTVAAKDTFCYVINCIGDSDSLFFATDGITPLIFFKVFDYENKKRRILEKRPLHCLTLNEYVTNNVVPKLKADLYLYLTTLGSVSHASNINVFDSLVIYDGKNYKLMTGVIEINFYNLLDFDQIHFQQCNSTVINTKAKVAPLVKNVRDGSMVVNIDQVEQLDPFGKMYLIKKENDLYTFSFYPPNDEDSPLSFYREFVYKPNYGIVSFKSPYLSRIKGEFVFSSHPLGVLMATEKHYDFK